jgi:hypothetical protein
MSYESSRVIKVLAHERRRRWVGPAIVDHVKVRVAGFCLDRRAAEELET